MPEQDIPESFLAKIFQSLVHAGLAVSQRGAHGGFSLARPSSEITIREIVEAVDGPIALNGCVLWPEGCQRSGGCRMHEVWVLAQERMMEVLGQVTLAELAPLQVSELGLKGGGGSPPAPVVTRRLRDRLRGASSPLTARWPPS